MHDVARDFNAESPLIVPGAAGPDPLARSSAPQACPPEGRILAHEVRRKTSRGRSPSPGRRPRRGQGRHQQLRPGPQVLAGWAVLTTAASVLVFRRSAVN